MYLIEYEQEIEKIFNSNYSDSAKASALNLLSNEISCRAWHRTHQSWADEVSGIAKKKSLELGGYSIEGLNELTRLEFLQKKALANSQWANKFEMPESK